MQRPPRFDHVQAKLEETKFFLTAMQGLQDRHHAEASRSLRVFDGEQGEVAKAFRYMLSAFLSAYRAVRYYVIRYSNGKPNSTVWRSAIDARPILAAFHHLRDTDIHDETLPLSMSVTVFNMDSKAKISAERMKLDPKTLVANKRFKNHRDHVTLLTSRPIIDLAVECFKDLEEVVAEGRALNFI